MNRIIIVTGGAGGIGRCIVEHFAAEGDQVYFIDIDREVTLNQVERMHQLGYKVTGFAGDVADRQALEDFAQLVLDEQPQGIHCLINNACLTNGGILTDCDYDEFLYIQRVGVVAPYMLAKLFRDHFCGIGSIVNISSTRAFQSQPNTESYTAAKGGITALTHALAISLSGVARVNSVAPGWIDTGNYHGDPNQTYTPFYSKGDIDQHPSNRVGEPEDIARVVAFLCDERNSFINGENITVDGGMSRLMIYHNDYGWKYQPTKLPIYEYLFPNDQE